MFITLFSKMPKAARIFTFVVGGTTLVVFVCALFGFFVQFLWNAVVAEVFGLPTISFWQAVGLFVLAKLFFGMGGSRSRQSKRKRKRHHHSSSEDEEKSVTLPAEEETEFTADASFKKYWQEEGREAYEAFLSLREKADKAGD